MRKIYFLKCCGGICIEKFHPIPKQNLNLYENVQIIDCTNSPNPQKVKKKKLQITMKVCCFNYKVTYKCQMLAETIHLLFILFH